MMGLKTVLTMSVVAGSVALQGQAQAANALWQGDLFIYSKSGTCANYDPVGNHGRVRYLPRNLGDNGPNSSFALYFADYAQGFLLANNSFSATPRQVDFHSIWDGSSGSPGFPVTVSFDAQTPATVKPTTKFISVDGTITNYDFQQGCTVKFRMALGLSTN